MAGGALEVVTASEYQKLMTKDQVRAQLGGLADVTDALLQTWIDQVTEMTLDQLNRGLAQERVRETFNVAAWREFQLSRYPVVEVHSLTVDDVAVDAQEWLLVDPRAGLVRLTGGPAGVVGGTLYLSGHQAADWSGIGDYGPAVTDQRSRYCWEYTGGYGLAGSSDTPALPLAIQFAAIDAIRAMVGYVQRDPTVKSMSLGDASWTFQVGSGASMAAAAESIQAGLRGSLSAYRNLAM